MFEYSKKIILVAMVLAVMLQCGFSYAADSYEVDLESAPIDASQLKATRFTPVLDAKINTGENLIYCQSFQAAWNSLCKEVLKGETAEIKNAPDYVKALNENINKPLSLSSDSYIAMVGLGKDGIADKFNEELKKKFGYASNIKNTSETEGINVFTSFDKKIRFINEHKLDKTPIHFYLDLDKTKKVYILMAYFEWRPYDTEDVRIGKKASLLHSSPFMMKDVDYRPIYGSIVRLVPSSGDEDIILASIPPGKTLRETYHKIVDFCNNDYLKYIDLKSLDTESLALLNSQMPQGTSRKYDYDYSEEGSTFTDRYMMPILKFKIQFNCAEIGSDKNMKIITRQIVNFDFDTNCGITEPEKLKVTYGLLCWRFGTIINPYTIFIRKRSSEYPYFMAYIGNDELFIKANEKLEE